MDGVPGSRIQRKSKGLDDEPQSPAREMEKFGATGLESAPWDCLVGRKKLCRLRNQML